MSAQQLASMGNFSQYFLGGHKRPEYHAQAQGKRPEEIDIDPRTLEIITVVDSVCSDLGINQARLQAEREDLLSAKEQARRYRQFPEILKHIEPKIKRHSRAIDSMTQPVFEVLLSRGYLAEDLQK